MVTATSDRYDEMLETLLDDRRDDMDVQFLQTETTVHTRTMYVRSVDGNVPMAFDLFRDDVCSRQNLQIYAHVNFLFGKSSSWSLEDLKEIIR